jgi:predicted nucleic acid-binding protein
MNAPDASQAVDMNILVYAHDRSAGPKHARVRELVRELWLRGDGCLSMPMLQEFHVAVT